MLNLFGLRKLANSKNKCIFDFAVDDLHAAVLQAEALGACKAENQFGGNEFVTMFDPEGHPFCLCAK